MLVIDAEPLGFRLGGQVIWPYAGGSEGAPEDLGDEGEDGDEGEGGGTGGSETDIERLTRAIDRERGLTKQARDGLRPWLALAKELGVKNPDEIRSRLKALTVEQQDHAAAVDAARGEVLSKANARIVRAEIKALAKDFADPADAVLNLRVEDYDVDDDGNVDEKSIKRDLADLLKRKPHLAAVSRKVDFEGGARRTAKGPGDMNDAIRNLARRR